MPPAGQRTQDESIGASANANAASANIANTVTYRLPLLLLSDATVRLDHLQVVQLSDQRQSARLRRQLLVGAVFSGCDSCRGLGLERKLASVRSMSCNMILTGGGRGGAYSCRAA